MSGALGVSPEELAEAKRRCDHGVFRILHCADCAAEIRPCGCGDNMVCDVCQGVGTDQQDAKPTAEAKLAAAHRFLALALERIEEARGVAGDEHFDSIADLAEEVEVQQQSLEAIYGAFVLRGGAR